MKKFARIICKGGILSIGELQKIVNICEQLHLDYIYFGSRQDIVLPIFEIDETMLKSTDLKIISGQDTPQNRVQNIVSSYVTSNIFKETQWLSSSKYLYILEQFEHQPQLKINITDPKQGLIPLFSGELNFIASEKEDYWYLNIQFEHWAKQTYFPTLIFSFDIAPICELIEGCYQDAINAKELFTMIEQRKKFNYKSIQNPLTLPTLNFPYYEGIQKMKDNSYWLGLYWKNNQYDVNFLRDFAGFCLKHRIGKINITPWKSFLTKGIQEKHLPSLERFLGKRGINVRHSSLELNWYIPLADKIALRLKNDIVTAFEKTNISTQGITFGIIGKKSKKKAFTTIIIEQNEPLGQRSYDIKHAEKFNDRNQKYVLYARDVSASLLPKLLIELSRAYFNTDKVPIKTVAGNSNKIIELYQCKKCMTLYDSSLGDLKNKITMGTPFKKLPQNYRCPVCEGGKKDYAKIECV